MDRFATEQAVVDALVQWATDPTLVIEKARELIASKEYIQGRINDQAQSLRDRIGEIDKSLERLFDAYQDGLLEKEEAVGRARPLKSEKQILETEIKRLETESGIGGVQGEVDGETLRQAFAQFGEVFEALHIQERKELLASVVKKVVAMPEGRLDIHMHLGILQLALGLKEEASANAGDGDLVIVLNTSKEIHMTKDFSEMCNFGERVQWLRQKHGLTKKELARNLGVNECTVANWEIRGRAVSYTHLRAHET